MELQLDLGYRLLRFASRTNLQSVSRLAKSYNLSCPAPNFWEAFFLQKSSGVKMSIECKTVHEIDPRPAAHLTLPLIPTCEHISVCFNFFTLVNYLIVVRLQKGKSIVKILNLYIILLRTQLYHFFPVSFNYLHAFIACCDRIFNYVIL